VQNADFLCRRDFMCKATFRDSTVVHSDASSEGFEKRVVDSVYLDGLLQLLSPRESFVTQLWSEGWTYSEIGKHLGASGATAHRTVWRSVTKMREAACAS
jgi:DNA-directed RNA polymerase specialized sigma24 family protein